MQTTRETCQNIIEEVTSYCSNLEIMQLAEYLYIYKTENCSKHFEVNNFIGRNHFWDKFYELRSRNTHANGFVAKGIKPKYFAIICEALKITDNGGSRLIEVEAY